MKNTTQRNITFTHTYRVVHSIWLYGNYKNISLLIAHFFTFRSTDFRLWRKLYNNGWCPNMYYKTWWWIMPEIHRPYAWRKNPGKHPKNTNCLVLDFILKVGVSTRGIPTFQNETKTRQPVLLGHLPRFFLHAYGRYSANCLRLGKYCSNIIYVRLSWRITFINIIKMQYFSLH